MGTIVARVLSAVIALGYLVAGIAAEILAHQRITPRTLVLVPMLLIPVAMIWFPDEIGSFTGYVGRGGFVDTETPPIYISVLGWFFLVGMPVLVCFLWS